MTQRECEDVFNYRLGEGPAGVPHVYVPAGNDPNDGAPLTLARPARPYEWQLWSGGRYRKLAELLAGQGAPVKVPPRTWGEWLRSLVGA